MKRMFWVAVASLLIAANADAAVVFHSAAGSGDVTSHLAPVSISPVPAENGVLIVLVSVLDPTGVTSSVTFAGLAMTRIGLRNAPNDATRVEAWSLFSPPTGQADVVVDLSAARAVFAEAAYFSGVDPSMQPLVLTNAGTTSTASVAVPNRDDTLTIDAVAVAGLVPGDPVLGPKQFILDVRKLGGGTLGASLVTDPPTATMSWGLGLSTDWAIAAVSLAPPRRLEIPAVPSPWSMAGLLLTAAIALAIPYALHRQRT